MKKSNQYIRRKENIKRKKTGSKKKSIKKARSKKKTVKGKRSKKITMDKFKDTMEEWTKFGIDFNSVGLHPDRLKEELVDLSNPNDIFIGKKQVIVEVRYPLSGPFEFILTALRGKKVFTRADFTKTLSKLYQRIYYTDKQTGEYGIFGHDLWDLSFSSAIYFSDKGIVKLFISS